MVNTRILMENIHDSFCHQFQVENGVNFEARRCWLLDIYRVQCSISRLIRLRETMKQCRYTIMPIDTLFYGTIGSIYYQ